MVINRDKHNKFTATPTATSYLTGTATSKTSAGSVAGTGSYVISGGSGGSGQPNQNAFSYVDIVDENNAVLSTKEAVKVTDRMLLRAIAPLNLELVDGVIQITRVAEDSELAERIALLEDMFEWDNGVIKAKASLYSVEEISSWGKGEGTQTSYASYLYELKDVNDGKLVNPGSADVLLMWDGTTWQYVSKDQVGLNTTGLETYLTNNSYATYTYVANYVDPKVTSINSSITTINNRLTTLDEFKDKFEKLFTVIYEDGVIVGIQANYDFYSVEEISAFGLGDSSEVSEFIGITVGDTTYTQQGGYITLPENLFGLDEEALYTYLTNNNYVTQEWVTDKNYATKTEVNALQTELTTLGDTVSDFLEGSDTDSIINKWKELEAFLAGQTETSTLADLLSVKADASVVNALSSEVTSIDSRLSAVEQWFTLNDGVLTTIYELVSEGEISAFSKGETSATSDFYGIVVGGTEYQNVGGFVTLPETLFGLDELALSEYLVANEYVTQSDIAGKADKATTLAGYGITDAKISNGVITLGGNTITPLTAHQTIYDLTFQAGTFSAKTFDPNGAAMTVNIPTTTAHISESGNLYFTNARAQAAVTGGASTIVTTDLTGSRALISNASGKVAVSSVTSTELGYLSGVTSSVQTQLNSKLNASTFDDLFEKVNVGTADSPVYAIKAKYDFYSVGEVSSYEYGESSDTDTSFYGVLIGTTEYRNVDGWVTLPEGLGGGTTEITSASIINALGYTPYDAANPDGFITSSALGDYLPLTGGTLSGNLTVDGYYFKAKEISGLALELSNAQPYIDFRFNNSTDDYTTRLIEDVQGQLTLLGSFVVSKGATLINDSTVLTINRTGGNNPLIRYQATGTNIGFLGFEQTSGSLVVRPNAQNNTTYYNVWHAGNFNPANYATQDWVTGKGYLTAHQSIYTLTLKNSAGTTVLTYTPNSAANSLTLTKALVGLGNVENTALSTWAGTNKITTLGTITTGTWNGTKIANDYLANSAISISGTSVSLGGSITQAALRTALGLGSNAYTSTAYLPLSGGAVTGTLEIRRNAAAIAYSDSSANRWGWLGFDAANSPSAWMSDGSTKYNLLHAGNYSSYALPLSGGTITGNLVVNRNPAVMQFLNNSTSFGYLGFSAKNVPAMYTADGATAYTLWHNGDRGFGFATGATSGTLYYCIAELPSAAVGNNTTLDLLVTRTHSLADTFAIIHLHIRNEAGTINVKAWNSVLNSGDFDLSGIILTKKVVSNVGTYKIYGKISSSWYSYEGSVLNQSAWGTVNGYWTVYRSGIVTSALTAIPSDETVVGSPSLATLYATKIVNNTTTGFYVGDRNSGIGTTDGGLLLYTYGSTPIDMFTGSARRMTITGAGNVGIGTASPVYKLHVVGSIYTSNNLTAAGEITAYGSSDIRLKTNIQPLDAINILRRLNVYSFDWTEEALRLKPDCEFKHGYGLIAQEVKQIIPEIVTDNMFEKGYYGIDYTKLIPFMISGIKTIDDEVTKLKRRIDELEEKVRKYEPTIKSLN